VAWEILQETAVLLSLWLGNIVDLLEPDVIILGGGVAATLGPFLDEIGDRLPSCCINSRCHEIPLLRARYGVDSGIVGGASIAANHRK
jgi:glucokinase